MSKQYGEHQPYDDKEYQAFVIVGDPQALAFEWIRAYTENLNQYVRTDDDDEKGRGHSPVTVTELIDVALDTVEGTGWGSYISRGGAFKSMSVDPMFWDKLSILKEMEIKEDNRNSFFSCSC